MSGAYDHESLVSTAGESGLRAVLAADPAAVVMLIVAVERGRISAFWGKESYALDARGKALFVQSLQKALEAITGVIAVESAQSSGELENLDDLGTLNQLAPTDHLRATIPMRARLKRWFRQLIVAWNKPHALDAAAKCDARLLVGVRMVAGGMQVIFEEGFLFGSAERSESLDLSGKMWLRDALQKALEVAEIKVAQKGKSRK